mgnify:CR=1 FL=1
MKKIIYQMLTGCYIVAALVLVAACNDGLDIQTKYPFTVETMPVPKELKVNETAEIRCELKREGRLGGHPVHDPLVPLRRGRHAQTGRRHGVAAQ